MIEKDYNPDFTIPYKGGLLYLEAKGYFQDSDELQKYQWVRRALKPKEELVFVFEDPSKPIHFQRRRQDGTKITHGEWAEKNGFRHFTITNLEALFDRESVSNS